MAKRKKVMHDAAAVDRSEEMRVEFIGGPFDGAWLLVSVEREGPDRILVNGRGYTKKLQPMRSPEVGQEAET